MNPNSPDMIGLSTLIFTLFHLFTHHIHNKKKGYEKLNRETLTAVICWI